MVDEHLNDVAPVPHTPTPEQPDVIALPIESRFLFVDVAALRAKQLRRGARPRLAVPAEGAPDTPADRPHKPERIAMEEVRQCLVAYSFPEPRPEPVVEGQ